MSTTSSSSSPTNPTSTNTTSTMSGDTILSTKVSRALSVRTDTPAMRSALEALAGLSHPDDNHHSHHHAASASTQPQGMIDPRSIRSTIEQSALQRALAFQTQFQSLANAATQLRRRAEGVERMAVRLEEICRGDVLVVVAEHLSFHDGKNNNNTNKNNDYNANEEEEDAWKKEQALATKLYRARQSYTNAIQRRIAVEAFLEKFDLSEEETRLLDCFDFESYQSSASSSDNPSMMMESGNGSGGSMEEAMAFLRALERLAVIRNELGKTFGSARGILDDDDDDDDIEEETKAHQDWTNDDDDADGILTMDTKSNPRRIGTHSALRMMEQLATRQERAHERLYQFIQSYLGIGAGAPPSILRNVPTSSSGISRSIDPYPYDNNNNNDTGTASFHGRFHDGDEMDEAYANIILRRALHVLRNSPARHVHALEMIAASRRAEVTRRFLLALTSGYGGVAPLEMRAHDPVGYVGDMLAFAFRSFRVEGELVKTLFVWKDEEEEGEDDGEEGGGREETGAMEGDEAQRHDDYDEDKEEDPEVSKPMDVTEMLSQSMGGLARPLGTRIKQVVKSLVSQVGVEEEDATVAEARSRMLLEGGTNDEEEDMVSSSLNRLVALFSICGLLKFYCSAVQNAMDKLEETRVDDDIAYASNGSAKNPFFTTCVESLIEAAESYVASLRAYGAMLSSHSTPDDSEAQLAQRLIVRIAEERAASPGFADDSSLDFPSEIHVSSKQLSLSFLVSTMVNAAIPYLKSLDDGAALKAALSSTVKCGLESAEAKKWIDLIQEKETELVEALVGAEADKVFAVCGLGGIQLAMEQMNAVYVDGMTMSSHPGLSPADIEAAMKQFYSSLYSPPIPTFEDSIKDPELRKVARSKIAQRVVDKYREIFDAISSEKGGYSDLSFLGHDPDQVKTLLSM
ncbi:hypothetical protein HJC23_004356 [Cyclotella cryptica]|uniref:Conserved Oligomeric Golgi complex subunit 6 C-terminal domain-containing protein n=1 Tax=Cyclotella cryptica TaxID=29204 RepID=A0ABD3NYJ0_9STRA